MACKHHIKEKIAPKHRWSLLSAFLLIILPKCPYCFVAYSSAITICGIPTENPQHWEFMLIGFLVVVIMGSLLLSYRGTQTLVALGLALTGSLLMVYGHNTHTLAFYHIGAACMLVSTLANRKIFLPRFWNKLT